MLSKRPGLRYAFVVDHHASPDAVVIASSHRMPRIGKVVPCEHSIPRQRYGEDLFVAMLERTSTH